MLATRTDRPQVRSEILNAFRNQARQGFTGPDTHRTHRDGWGMVGQTRTGLTYLGRSAEDASQDPAYPRAVERSQDVDPRGFLLAHVRNASLPKKPDVNNSHPFLREGWAFAHNGTVYDLDPPSGRTPQGSTDSERFFLHLLEERFHASTMEAAIGSLLPKLAFQNRHSSLTFLLTNGSELYAFRWVGPDPGSCGTMECAQEYYALGIGTYKGALVATQEPQFLPHLEGWKPIEQGQLVHVDSRGSFRSKQYALSPNLSPLPVSE